MSQKIVWSLSNSLFFVFLASQAKIDFLARLPVWTAIERAATTIVQLTEFSLATI